MQKIVLIPGLGADYRVYRNINLAGYEVVKVTWLIPEKTDTLASYAQKLIGHYCIEPGDIVIGNSLGGMLGIEIAKKIKLNKTILISSITTADESPRSYRWYRLFPLYRLLPAGFFTSLGIFARYVVGGMSREDEQLVKDMLKKTPPVFFKWAMGAALHWDNQTVPENVYHIHGDRDRVFPYRRIRQADIIHGGTHIMILNRAADINNWLKNILPL
ncbi:MAG TPA: alpha/beta hydrolase [Mucilaginibacter sp.]|nr:alpha/beta hydrolase [Mucilaginibacter sp.]